MSPVLALPQVKDFLKTLAKGKEKGQDQGKKHDVNAHAVTEEGELSKKPWDEDIPELSRQAILLPLLFLILLIHHLLLTPEGVNSISNSKDSIMATRKASKGNDETETEREFHHHNEETDFDLGKRDTEAVLSGTSARSSRRRTVERAQRRAHRSERSRREDEDLTDASRKSRLGRDGSTRVTLRYHKQRMTETELRMALKKVTVLGGKWAFEQYAELKHIMEEEWGKYFPRILKEAAEKWYYHYPASKLQAYKKLKKAFILEYTDDRGDEDILCELDRLKQESKGTAPTVSRNFFESNEGERPVSFNGQSEDSIPLPSSATDQNKESNKQKSSTSTANNEEVSSSEQIYEYCSNDEVDSNPTAEVRTDKKAEAMAKRKSGMPNWLLPDDQEVEEWKLGSEEDPKMIKINKHLKKELKDKAWDLFLKFKDVFAWEHTDLKGVDSEVCQHRISLKPDAKPIRLQRYRMNPNYAKKVKEEIDNLLKARFITEVESNDWLFPIVVVPKKNGKLKVCVNYRKLNAQTIKDPFPLPFTDMMLDEIAGHEMYSFMDGYSGYNQLNIAPEDKEKTTFITEWGAFMYLVMPFGLCNAPATFQHCMMEIFSEFLHRFLAIFVDDFTIYSTEELHILFLEMVFQRCREKRICLNPFKSVFMVTSSDNLPPQRPLAITLAHEPQDIEGSSVAGKRLLEGPTDLPGSKRPKLLIKPPVPPVIDIVPLTKPVSVDILDSPVRSLSFNVTDFQNEEVETTRLMIKRDKLQQLQKDRVKDKFVIDNQINPTLTYDAPTSRFVLENETVQSLIDSGVLAIQTEWNTIVNGSSQMMAAAYQAPEEYKKELDREKHFNAKLLKE
ncbi:hypothetical protein L7F22_041450 [Adiantum nelumboides]|nr:hypothetical protein [Adiantum nelumboides]